MKYLKLALIFAILVVITLIFLEIINAKGWTNTALLEGAKVRYAILGGLSI